MISESQAETLIILNTNQQQAYMHLCMLIYI
jgi:hypothetical protein